MHKHVQDQASFTYHHFYKIRGRIAIAEERQWWIFSITVLKPTVKEKLNTCKYSTYQAQFWSRLWIRTSLKLVELECHNEKEVFTLIRIRSILVYLVFNPKILYLSCFGYNENVTRTLLFCRLRHTAIFILRTAEDMKYLTFQYTACAHMEHDSLQSTWLPNNSHHITIYRAKAIDQNIGQYWK